MGKQLDIFTGKPTKKLREGLKEKNRRKEMYERQRRKEKLQGLKQYKVGRK